MNICHREVIRLYAILNKLGYDNQVKLGLYPWLDQGIPPEDMDRALAILDLIRDELNLLHDNCEKAQNLVQILRQSCGAEPEINVRESIDGLFRENPSLS